MNAIDAAMTPAVSIIIPTYGRKDFLADAVASVLQQTIIDWELFIVDDASPTPIDQDEHDDHRIRILRHIRNRGPAAARNTGAAAASGKWLAFLDDDDMWHPKRLECALHRVASTRSDICVACTQRRLEGNCHAEILTTTAPHLGATMIRKDAFVPFDERYQACEDLEWWIRVSEHEILTTVPMPLFLWRRHYTSRCNNGTLQRILYSKRLLEEHYRYFATYPVARAFRLFRLGYMLQHSREYGEAIATFWSVATTSQAPLKIRASALKRIVEMSFRTRRSEEGWWSQTLRRPPCQNDDPGL